MKASNTKKLKKPASALRRTAAASFDWFLVSVLIYLNSQINDFALSFFDSNSFYASKLYWLIPAALVFYHPLLESSPLQGSLGKFILGIKVGDFNQNKLFFKQSLLRTACKILFTFATLGVGFYSAILSPRRRTIYDRLSKSGVYLRF